MGVKEAILKRAPRVLMIKIAPGDRSGHGLTRLRGLLNASVRKLDKANAWPSNVGKYAIDIVYGAAINTRYEPGPVLDTDVHPYPMLNLRIEVGLQILTSPMFEFFVNAQLDEADVVSFLLAHEIFHLTEIARQNSCNVPTKFAGSGFARSIRKEMSSEWQEMALNLAKIFTPFYRSSPKSVYVSASVEALRANDAVSEACADLLALEITRTFVSSPNSLQNAAVAFRVQEEAKGGEEYRCGTAMAALSAVCAGTSPEAIIAETWRWAIGELINAPDLPVNLKQNMMMIDLKIGKATDQPSQHFGLADFFRKLIK